MKISSLFCCSLRWIPAFIFSILFMPTGYAQLGYSSASVSIGKMQSNYSTDYVYVAGYGCQGHYVAVPLLPDISEIVVEEYINYHRHRLVAPANGQSVGLDLRWDRIDALSDEFVLQAGFSTEDVKDLFKMPPINVCLVIDHSGSMTGDRISKAKIAAEEFIRHLRPEDILSIVIFDDIVDIIYPAQRLGKGTEAINAVRYISPRGSTDLNSGLLCGYKEVLKNYNRQFNNKVIMLTDALTNTGEIDPENIVRNSLHISENVIDITIIGVGVDFNNNLSRKITSSAHTSIFFINDNEDIKKTFVDEIQSLMGKIATDVEVEISYSNGLVLDQVYGYKPNYGYHSYNIRLNDMNNGLTQVVLMKFRPSSNKNPEMKIKVVLSYFDIKKNEKVSIQREISPSMQNLEKCKFSPLSDSDIRKNFTIAEMSQAIYDMALAGRCKDFSKACLTVDRTLSEVKTRYNCMNDPDIQRIYTMLETYSLALGDFREARCCDY